MSSTSTDPPLPALHLDLKAGSDAPATARAALAGFCDECGLSSETRATVMLLTSELVANAVIHPTPKADKILLMASINGDRVRIDVTDHGRGFTPVPRAPTRKRGGYGLYLVAHESDDWGVLLEPGTTVWFEVGASL